MSAPGWVAGSVDRLLEVGVVGSFSRLGYETRRRLAGWQDLPPLDGRTVLLTGATSGIGRAAAELFVGAGAHVAIVGRDEQRLAAVAQDLGLDETYRADLSDLSQVADLAADFSKRHDRLDVLVHNAGALVDEHRLSPQGFEETYAAQVLAPQLLTTELLPLLTTAGGRVLVVSSGGMYTQRLDPETVEMRPDGFDGVRAYARAKRAQVTLVEEWARRHDDLGVTFHAMHPGWADTPGVRTSLPTFRRVTGPLLRTPAQGADTIVWLAGSPEAVARNGRFWLDRRPRGTQRLPGTAPDAATAARLWEHVTEQIQAVTTS